MSWLLMQAHGDLKNDHASKSKRFEREWLVESALLPGPITDEPSTVGDQTASYDIVPAVNGRAVFAAVRAAFPDERDRQLIWLICVEGSRSTDEAARVLGLEGLPLAERAVQVKRHKDRVMRRMRRMRLDDEHE